MKIQTIVLPAFLSLFLRQSWGSWDLEFVPGGILGAYHLEKYILQLAY